MAGEYETEDEYPIGFRFKPKDEELVEYYLVPRLRRQPNVPNDCITECDVYSCHPDTLTKEHRGVDQEEWYFLSPRSRMYGNGVRPARKTRDGRGRWKASTASKEVDRKVVCNGITFCRCVLNYFEGVPKKEVRTKWIMLELKVPCFEIKLDKAGPTNMLDELVVCKIYVSPQHKKRGDADEESTSSACEGEDGDEEASQHGQGTAGSMSFSEKQAGKRLMLDKVRPGSLGSSASTQARCSTSNAPRTQAYYGAPVQPSGAHSSSQHQQAPQMPHQQGGAFHGQRLVQQPTQQTPALYHQSFTEARDHHFGQATATMTTRPAALVNLGFPGNPARRHPGWAWPQVSLQCYYDQNYRGVKPPAANASSSQPPMLAASSSFLPPPPPQQPFFNGDANANRRGAAAGSYPYQSGALTSEAAGHDGASNGRNAGAARCLNVNAEQYFVDLAMTTSNPSLMTGARTTQMAPAPPAAGAVKVETETGQMSGLNKKDDV